MALIRVVGLGYVGLTTALGLSKLGHIVEGVDIDKDKIASLSQGTMPFFEAGMQDLLTEQLESRTVTFCEIGAQDSSAADFTFICVPTPSAANGSVDLTHVDDAVSDFKASAKPGSTLIIKSTVPIGTGSQLALDLQSEGFDFAGSPEFLREGSAVQDFFFPDRIIVGSDHEEVADQVLALFSELDCPKTAMSLAAAETTKYAANSYLAVRLSFINEVARLCEAVGADINEVSKGLSQDKRIGGHFLSAGPGWGGSCFPKDVRAIVHSASLHNLELPTVAAASLSNEIAQNRVVKLALQELGGSVKGKKIAVWGLTYKANTDDVRESPAVSIVRQLCSLGGLLYVFDPRAVNVEIQGLTRVNSALDACEDAELLIVTTEWAEFREIDPQIACASMETARVLDSRNVLESEKWVNSADYFWATGRQTVHRM